MDTLTRTAVSAVTTLLIAACATAPEAPAPPPFELASDHFVGTVRTGRVVGVLPEATASPLTVRLRETLVDEQPAPGSPVQASLVFAAGGGETLRRGSMASR